MYRNVICNKKFFPVVIEHHQQVMTVKESVSKCVVLDGLLICSSQSGLSYASLKGKSGQMELVPVVGINPDTLIQRGTRVQVKITIFMRI